MMQPRLTHQLYFPLVSHIHIFMYMLIYTCLRFYVYDPHNFFIMLIIRIKWTFTIIIKSYYYDYDSTCKSQRLSVGSDFFAIAGIQTICTGTSRQFFIANKKRLQANTKYKYICLFV